MSYRTDRTLADFIAGALSPPLIMALVGSLVFFLLEILYQGMFRGPLQWVLFCFVFGAVLVARISMQAGIGNRSPAYGAALGAAVWLALQNYVDYGDNPDLAARGGLINLGLIVLIWWSAHRLTWDCTFVDDDEANAGIGLLDVAGLDDAAGKKPEEKKKKKTKDRPGLEGWWDRFQRYRAERKRRPRSPGLWVVLFSLAALPLFGLGQTRIPPEELERRRYAFSLLVLYVGAGLGLLLTTSFLGLRSYLRQRKVTMPIGITLVWLVFGAVLICGMLFVSDFLPRPADPQPLWDWMQVASPARDPAPWSPFDADDDQKDEKKEDKKEDAKTKAGLTPDNSDRKDDDKTKQGSKGSGNDKGNGDKKGQGEKKGQDEKKGQGQKSGNKGDKKGSAKETKKGFKRAAKEEGSKMPPFLAPIIEFLIKVGRWIIIVLVVGAIAFWLLRGVLGFLANFTFWAQKLLALLEKLKQGMRVEIDTEGTEEKKPSTPRPFASFRSPFVDGRAEYLSAAELVRYSFAAWQAWGREHGIARAAGETPQEYARRTQEEYPDLGKEAVKLAMLYGRLAYSTDSLSEVQAKMLRAFWQVLTQGADRSMEAVEG